MVATITLSEYEIVALKRLKRVLWTTVIPDLDQLHHDIVAKILTQFTDKQDSDDDGAPGTSGYNSFGV